MVELDKKSVNFLRAVDDHGGRASTSEIRDKTTLSNSATNYRFDKLQDRGLIDIERDPDATPQGVAAAKIAILTDKAKDEISKGLLVEAKRTESDKPDIDSLASDLADIDEEVHAMRTAMNERILPYARSWERLTATLFVAMDNSEELDISLQELAETSISDEELAFLRRRVTEE